MWLKGKTYEEKIASYRATLIPAPLRQARQPVCQCGTCRICRQRDSMRRCRERMPWPDVEEDILGVAGLYLSPPSLLHPALWQRHDVIGGRFYLGCAQLEYRERKVNPK